MGTMIRRAILPTLLLIGGIAAIVYGAFYHRVPVLEEKLTETTISVPANIPMPPPSPFDEGMPFDQPPPAMTQKTVTRVDREIKMVSEGTVVREVTVGGLVLLANGTIKQTYTGDKGPALCPS